LRKLKIAGIGIAIFFVIIFSIKIASTPSSDVAISENTREESENRKIQFNQNLPSLFETYGYEKDVSVVNGTLVFGTYQFELKDELMDLYEEIALWNDAQKTVVISPVFTTSAYVKNGFYDYYNGACDTSCLTTKILSIESQGHAGSQHAVKVLSLLGYSLITDIDVDKNPKILQEYDKVILLHNEYVTKNEFEAIVNHSNVVYLYPNALYAEIKTNYEENTITLVRGHSYPDKEIRNGFDWKFDNSELEYDLLCKDWNFNKIDNGVMLNCYPENVIFINFELLKAIKEL
jgi:hypothetical protein